LEFPLFLGRLPTPNSEEAQFLTISAYDPDAGPLRVRNSLAAQV
jgi:hypothetical protein